MAKVKKFKAEAFDLMQYFYGAVHEPLIHCLIRFSGHVDEAALKKTVTLSGDANSLIQCCFDAKTTLPCWKKQGFTGEDMVHLVEAGPNAEDQKLKLFASTIDIAREPQLKIYLVRERDADTLCIIINHMVCDGSGFKEYLYLLAQLYTSCKKNLENVLSLDSASRSAGQLFDSFTLVDKLGILCSKYDLSKQKQQAAYRLQGDKSNPFFTTLQITREEFESVKAYAKNQGVTVNDLILAAYVRVLHRETGNERIIVPPIVFCCTRWLFPKA